MLIIINILSSGSFKTPRKLSLIVEFTRKKLGKLGHIGPPPPPEITTYIHRWYVHRRSVCVCVCVEFS